MLPLTNRTSLIASAAAAIGASICCVGPLLLLSFGIGGAWVGRLTLMEPYRPIFIGLTLVFLGLAFRKLYLTPPACMPGALCANPAVIRRQRLIFWIVAMLLLTLLTFPLFAPLLY